MNDNEACFQQNVNVFLYMIKDMKIEDRSNIDFSY